MKVLIENIMNRVKGDPLEETFKLEYGVLLCVIMMVVREIKASKKHPMWKKLHMLEKMSKDQSG